MAHGNPRWNSLWIYALSVVVHLSLVAPGVFHQEKSVIQSTDIDYAVFVGGQRAALGPFTGQQIGEIPQLRTFLTVPSPYARATYRYTPVMGMLTQFNLWFDNDTCAKYLFCVMNFITFVLTERILKHYKVSHQARTILLAITALNPVTIQIAARGNSDAVMTALVASCLYCYLKRWYFVSAVILGLAIHVKMYPILFVIPMTIAMIPQTNPLTVLTEVISPIGPAVSRLRSLNESRKQTWLWQLWGCFKLATYVVLTPFIFAHKFAFEKMNRSQWMFALVSITTAATITYLVYEQYGWVALYEGFLYHFVRHDHRHNMSVFSPWATLVTPQRYYGVPLSVGVGPLKLLSLFCNKILVLATGITLAHICLPLALFVQVLLFVAFNGVITVQYFVWFSALLPVAIAAVPKWRPVMHSNDTRKILHLLRPLFLMWWPLWMGSILCWVFLSYLFETCGWLPAFYLMLIADIGILVAHIGMACFVLQDAQLTH